MNTFIFSIFQEETFGVSFVLIPSQILQPNFFVVWWPFVGSPIYKDSLDPRIQPIPQNKISELESKNQKIQGSNKSETCFFLQRIQGSRYPAKTTEWYSKLRIQATKDPRIQGSSIKDSRFFFQKPRIQGSGEQAKAIEWNLRITIQDSKVPMMIS